jgi:prepilin-type N-terminal cleavage/methylation domain-containing protein
MSTSPTLRRSAGFTLLEILAAVSVLAIIVLFMANIFSNSSRVWKLGNKRIESNNAGRAAIEYIAREISTAYVDGNFEMRLFSDKDTIYPGGDKSDRIAFMSGTTTPQYSSNLSYKIIRQIKQCMFAVVGSNNGPYTLVQKVFQTPTEITQASQNTTWPDDISAAVDSGAATMNSLSVVAENVRNVEFFVYVMDPTSGKPALVSDYKSWAPPPGFTNIVMPLYVDVYLEVLGEEDAIKAANGLNKPEDLRRMTRRYFTRAYLPNAQGAARD